MKTQKMKTPITSVGLLLLLTCLSGKLKPTRALNSILDLNGTFPYLINKTSGQVIEPRDYMDFDNIYTPDEQYRRQQTAQGRLYHLLKAFDFANYYQSDYWHYSSEEDLLRSAWPVADADRCAQDLNWMESQMNDTGRLFERGQQHTKLMQMVDAFGRPEASTFMGHGHWLGSYTECSRVAIDTQLYELEQRCNLAGLNECNQTAAGRQLVNQHLKARYCIGKTRFADWPSSQQDDYVPTVTIKTGLCLPESCETLSIRRHRAQIERLMLYQVPSYLRPRLRLQDMYCLPDARSPIRSFGLATRIFLGVCAIWLLALLAATMAYSTYKRHRHDVKIILRQAATCCQQSQQQPVADTCRPHKEPSSSPTTKFLNYMVCSQAEAEQRSPSEAKNVAQLLLIKTSQPSAAAADSQVSQQQDLSPFQSEGSGSLGTSSASLAAWLHESPFLVRLLQAMSVKENIREFQKPPMLLRDSGANRRLRINLNALDSIKCLCCILVIFGHIVFIHMQHLNNILHTIELSHEIYPRFLIAFFNFVDTFFIISGMLTAYFVFKRFNKHNFSHPLQWAQVTLLRLLRLSPVYLLVFWFAKTTTVHLSEGPLWDYGTDRNSNKGLCVNDHWWKSLLYLGNWGTMQPLCILPAWSIIVDAQYSIVVPPLLYLILKHKRLGYATLLVAIVVSTANMSRMLATQTAVKTSDMAKVRLHVYPLISRFAAEFYNTAWNRVGPVAVGILGGHLLYLYDLGIIRRWPWFMRGTPFKFVLFMHLFIFVLPTIGRLTDDPESSSDSDMTIFVLSNATIKPLWSLINTIFLLRLITDLRHQSVLARLMSHNLWHCLGKLCFSSYLIHYEVIMVLLKSRQDGLMEPCWSNVTREFSLAFLASTLLAYLIHILYEAPINKLISLALAKPSYSQHRPPADEAGQATFEKCCTTAPGANGAGQTLATFDKETIDFTVIGEASKEQSIGGGGGGRNHNLSTNHLTDQTNNADKSGRSLSQGHLQA